MDAGIGDQMAKGHAISSQFRKQPGSNRALPWPAVRDGKKPLPTLFCDAWFSHGWLGAANAENQIAPVE